MLVLVLMHLGCTTTGRVNYSNLLLLILVSHDQVIVNLEWWHDGTLV